MDSPTSPIDCDADGRKRVCKACDRCRIKKSKCDGKKPCSRCRNDDAICVFGGRKRKTDKVHPKGYVEVLERQQKQLVKGIRALYDRQLSDHPWDGPRLYSGYPPTHEILEYLGALDVEVASDEGHEDSAPFEENVHRLRKSIVELNNSRQPGKPGGVSKLHHLLTNQRPEDYIGKVHFETTNRSASPPMLSPDALGTTTQTPPSTSIDSQHWSTSSWLDRKAHTSLDGDLVSANDVMTFNEHVLDSSPMQIAFEDSFLVPPWDSTNDIKGLLCL